MRYTSLALGWALTAAAAWITVELMVRLNALGAFSTMRGWVDALGEATYASGIGASWLVPVGILVVSVIGIVALVNRGRNSH